MVIAPENLERIANMLLDLRYRTDTELRPDCRFSEPWVTSHDDATLQMNYMGFDGNDTYFFYTAFLLFFGVLSVTGEFFDSSEPEIDPFFELVMSGLRYGRSPE